MRNYLFGLITALTMAFMLPAYAVTADGLKPVDPTYSVTAIEKMPDHPVPTAHVACGVLKGKERQPITVLFVAVGTASEIDSIMGEDDHYKSITADRPSKIPVMG